MPRVRYFAAAAEAAGVDHELVDAATLGDLRDALIAVHGASFGRVLDRCSLLVDGVAGESADVPLSDATGVDVLPPFAGG